jgi:hypothetical protein
MRCVVFCAPAQRSRGTRDALVPLAKSNIARTETACALFRKQENNVQFTCVPIGSAVAATVALCFGGFLACTSDSTSTSGGPDASSEAGTEASVTPTDAGNDHVESTPDGGVDSGPELKTCTDAELAAATLATSCSDDPAMKDKDVFTVDVSAHFSDGPSFDRAVADVDADGEAGDGAMEDAADAADASDGDGD